MNTENGKLVFKYKMLDLLLTKLITEKENNFSQSELLKRKVLLYLYYVVSNLLNVKKYLDFII